MDRSAVVNTDEHPGYKNPLKAWKEHHAVNHSRGEYQRKNDDGSIASINTAESFFSLLKRGVVGAWHHVSRKHLPKYANEFAFRWSHRNITDGERLQRFVPMIANKRITYRNRSQSSKTPALPLLASHICKVYSPAPSRGLYTSQKAIRPQRDVHGGWIDWNPNRMNGTKINVRRTGIESENPETCTSIRRPNDKARKIVLKPGTLAQESKPICPHCPPDLRLTKIQSKPETKNRARSLGCIIAAACRKPFTATVGTVLEDFRMSRSQNGSSPFSSFARPKNR